MIPNNKYKFTKKLDGEAEYQTVADDLLAFAQKESSLDINKFPLGLMINPEAFAAFSEHSEYFATAYDTSLRIIGARIKQLVYQGAIDRLFALEILPLYDPEYRQYLREKKSKDDTVPGKTKIVLVESNRYHTVPDSVWVKYHMQFSKRAGYTESELNEKLRCLCDFLNDHVEEEEMEILTKLTERVRARRLKAEAPIPQQEDNA